MFTLKNQLTIRNEVPFRFDTLEGTQHLVAPVSMLGVGVWKGSGGAVDYSEEELEKSVREWNHRPILLNHPEEGYSGCAVDVINKSKLGSIQNTFFDKESKKLKAEAWFNIPRCGELAPNVLSSIHKNKILEVSTGLSGQFEKIENSDSPPKIKDIAPDHLAVLPFDKGAYSVADGGGILNKSYSMNDLREALYGNASVTAFVRTVPGYDYYFIEDVFEDSFVVSVSSTEGTGEYPKYKNTLYEALYEVSESGTVSVLGDFEKVVKKTEYVSQENQLMENKTNEQAVNNAEQASTASVVTLPVFNSFNDLRKYENLSESLKNELETALEFTKNSKQELVESIFSNKHNLLEKDELEAFPMERLKTIANKLAQMQAPAPAVKNTGEGEGEGDGEGEDDGEAGGEGAGEGEGVTNFRVMGVGNRANSAEPEEVKPFLVNVFRKAD